MNSEDAPMPLSLNFCFAGSRVFELAVMTATADDLARGSDF